MRHPLKVTVIGQVQNPSEMIPLNVNVTIPVVVFCEHEPVGVPVTLLNDQLGYNSAWSIVQLSGTPPPVQAKRIPNDPVEYPHTKSQGPVLVSVPVITVVGQPVLQLVFGGIGVDGPAENDMVVGNALSPQHGKYAGL